MLRPYSVGASQMCLDAASQDDPTLAWCDLLRTISPSKEAIFLHEALEALYWVRAESNQCCCKLKLHATWNATKQNNCCMEMPRTPLRCYAIQDILRNVHISRNL